MFLIKWAFWIGLVVLLLPTDERQQARFYETAALTVERVSTFCDRNPKTCAMSSDLWASFVKKAEFGARMAYDLAVSQMRKTQEPVPQTQPANAPRQATPRLQQAPTRGTLTADDLAPAWRGHVQRTGT
jgi:hypothetical protein